MRQGTAAIDTLRYWNEVAVNASGLDHTPPAPGENRETGEQLGPGRSSRAMAIVHIAMFDAANSIRGGYRSYTGLHRSWPGASVNAAIAQAAHDTLVAMFPAQRDVSTTCLRRTSTCSARVTGSPASSGSKSGGGRPGPSWRCAGGTAVGKTIL